MKMTADKLKTELPDWFRIGEASYQVDEFGVIHQLQPFTMPSYDVGYVATRYDTIPEAVANISFLRAGFIAGVCGPVNTVLDVGYGNGGFLRAMQLTGAQCSGCDVSHYPVPEGCEPVRWNEALGREWDLVTFFDSLEHLPSLNFLAQMQARWLAITVPCVAEEATPEWLAAWKHLRPGEHLHHFKMGALRRLLAHRGYERRAIGHPEDMIRRGMNGELNTFSAIFRKES